MRILLILTLGSLLAGGAMAQRGGGGARGGGGGGSHVGGGSMGSFRGGGSIGGFRGGGGGFVGNYSRGGFGGYGYGYRGGFGYRGYGYGWGGYWGGYYPYWGFGVGYWPDYYDYSYPYSYYGGYDYPAYQPSSNVTVVYPNQQAYPANNSVYVQRARPVNHDYDEYGQEIRQSGSQASPAPASSSPIYLIAMKDGVIRAAASYWVNGQTLHYVTMEHQEQQVPLSDIDRALSGQLNRERRVQFQLPQ